MKKVFKTAAFMLAMGLMTSTFTACGEDDENKDGEGEQGTGSGSFEEVLKSNGIVARAQTSGKVIIDGSITSNKKIKWFGLSSSADKECDVKNWSEAAQEKTKDKEEGKSFTITLSGEEVSMSDFPCFLTIKTDGKKVYEKVGEDFSIEMGDANNLTKGSYASLKEEGGKVYLLGDFYDQSTQKLTNVEVFKKLDVFVNLEGELRPISEAKFYKNVTADEKKDAVKSFIGDNTIISSNNVIARINDKETAGAAAEKTVTYTFKGIALGVKGSVKVSTDDCKDALSK
jgi:hypothetical protein